MIEKQFLVVDKLLKFPPDCFLPLNVNVHPHGLPNGFITQPPKVMGHDHHFPFQWLRFVPGLVNQTHLGAVDVLSGMFSGCWMAIYQMHGVDYVGHIGTKETANDPDTRAVKRAWRNFANTAGVNAMPFIAFRPHAVLQNDPYVMRLLAKYQRPPKVLGLVTRDKHCYSAVLVDEGPQYTYRVIAVRPQQPRAGLQNLFSLAEC